MRDKIGKTGCAEIDDRRGWCNLCRCPLSLCVRVQKLFLFARYVYVCEMCLERVDRRRTASAIVKLEKPPFDSGVDAAYRRWKRDEIAYQIRQMQLFPG